jgi:hypothetical protein
LMETWHVFSRDAKVLKSFLHNALVSPSISWSGYSTQWQT